MGSVVKPPFLVALNLTRRCNLGCAHCYLDAGTRLDGKSWQCGKDAANALAEKIARRPVTCEDLGRDRYKRIIGRCTVAGEDLGK